MPCTNEYYAEYLILWGWCAAIKNIRYKICGLRYEDMKHKINLCEKHFKAYWILPKRQWIIAKFEERKLDP